MKKVYINDLPKQNGYSGMRINWYKSIGYKIHFIYNDIKGWVEIINYNKEQLTIKYEDREFGIDITHFKNCQLGKLLGKHTNDFKIEIGTPFKDKNRNIVIKDKEMRQKERINKKGNKYIEYRKWYKYTCNKCGWTEGWIDEGQLLGKKQGGCSCCHSFTLVQGINDIPTTAPWMVKYFQGGYDEAKLYTRSSNNNIYPICIDCGRVKSKPMPISDIYYYHSISCFCSDKKSYPSKFIFNVLEQICIKFKTEYSPQWCNFRYKDKPRQGFYDFCFELNNKKYIVEADGEFHSKDNNMSGQTSKESNFIDNEKDRLAKEHDIEVIRIDCVYDKIENRVDSIKNNVLNSSLINLFDLSNINWDKCNEFALSNLVKQVCDYWNSGINSTKEIGSIMKVSQSTIIDYLKRGSSLSWCNYDVENEKYKRMKNSSISIICLETREVFTSISECARASETVFGIKLSRSMIGQVCSGVINQTKGYHFKYYTNNKEAI